VIKCSHSPADQEKKKNHSTVVFNERLSQANRKRDRSTPPATLSVFFVLFYQGEAPEPIKKTNTHKGNQVASSAVEVWKGSSSGSSSSSRSSGFPAPFRVLKTWTARVEMSSSVITAQG